MNLEQKWVTKLRVQLLLTDLYGNELYRLKRNTVLVKIAQGAKSLVEERFNCDCLKGANLLTDLVCVELHKLRWNTVFVI